MLLARDKVVFYFFAFPVNAKYNILKRETLALMTVAHPTGGFPCDLSPHLFQQNPNFLF